MPDLNIRNVALELIVELKKSALDHGVTLREFCIGVLSGPRLGFVAKKVRGDAGRKSRGGAVRDGEVSRDRDGVSGRTKSRKTSVRSVAAVEPGPDESVGGDAKAVTVSGMGWSALGLVTGRELLEDESSCSYKEYDQESGETMGCGLAKHSAKQKHGNWRRL